MKKDIVIPNEINDIVNVLKSSIPIISITESAGVSTIITQSIILINSLNSSMLLKNGMMVAINNVNYQVSNVVNTPSIKSFDISAIGIVATSWSVAANFHTGSRFEINQILNKEAGDLNRFPLIWLLPTGELNYDNKVFDFKANVTIVFAHKANKTDRTLTRFENNIEPVIQPLVRLFNLWLQSSRFNYMFEFGGFGKQISYVKSDFPFYGTDDKSKSVLNVTTDAIEVGYDLQFKKQY